MVHGNESNDTHSERRLGALVLLGMIKSFEPDYVRLTSKTNSEERRFWQLVYY